MDSRSERHHGTLVSAPDLHAALARALTSLRRPDGGLPVSLEGASEVEPTALAALALDDAGARRWLATRQRRDGGFEELEGRRDGPTTAALVALALDDPVAARRSLAYAIARRGLPLPNAADPERRTAWGWTGDARSLVEPTARVLLAVNALTPNDAATRREALGLLTARQCAGRRLELRQRLRLRRRPARLRADDGDGAHRASEGTSGVVERAFGFLRGNWRLEPGGLTVAQALVAYRLHGRRDEAPALLAELRNAVRRPSFLSRPLAVAWATLATGPDALLEPLRSRA